MHAYSLGGRRQHNVTLLCQVNHFLWRTIIADMLWPLHILWVWGNIIYLYSGSVMSGLQLLSAPVVFAMISAICTNLNSVDSDHICATGPASCNELQWPSIIPYLVDCSIGGSWYHELFILEEYLIPKLCFLNLDFQISYTSLRWYDSSDSEIHLYANILLLSDLTSII